jgi:hypothetical protein
MLMWRHGHVKHLFAVVWFLDTVFGESLRKHWQSLDEETRNKRKKKTKKADAKMTGQKTLNRRKRK